ncbi:hypothetical protein BJX66DRAFT_315691 [Aspergillus keveii]|uniref:GPI anchored protein n=1 Tax=Aspergillus keveii TaxID=714993 RepID=A0ABR4FP88_9EURO
MLLFSILLGVASVAQVSANTDTERAVRRNAAIQGVRKMSDDEGEKFFMDYWQYKDKSIVANMTESADSSRNTEIDRRTILPRSYPFNPPFAPGLERLSGLRLSPLVRKDFECPTGTYGCTSINRPDNCCRTEETCVVVDSGDVGCCPAGQDCSGTIGSCWEGYTSCPSSLGGGCCIPGYDCVDGGCAHIVTITITTHSTTLTTTTIETVPTVTSTSTPETTTTTTTSDTSSETSSDTTSSTSTDLSSPDRPTSLSTSTTSSTEPSCPTGFYACAAVYQGGCCRTGRDCDTTSCPAIPSTTIVSNDQTIVIPEATTTATSSGGSGSSSSGCASGWFSCADTVGGGCCPSGYACGEESCTAAPAASTSGTVAKEDPAAPANTGGTSKIHWKMMMYTTLGMIWTML